MPRSTVAPALAGRRTIELTSRRAVLEAFVVRPAAVSAELGAWCHFRRAGDNATRRPAAQLLGRGGRDQSTCCRVGAAHEAVALLDGAAGRSFVQGGQGAVSARGTADRRGRGSHDSPQSARPVNGWLALA
jgi:hypothetical protein